MFHVVCMYDVCSWYVEYVCVWYEENGYGVCVMCGICGLWCVCLVWWSLCVVFNMLSVCVYVMCLVCVCVYYVFNVCGCVTGGCLV